ncbi:MAG TPA: helix-turn-helix transcriptional regulator [Puia sp.]|nr:helix-turn-helix transcriptional regulator [Puia sp.]
MASKIFAEMLAKVEPEDRQFVQKNLAISYQVRAILDNHPTIHSQKDLAEAMGKEPSEISKWLSGLHNIGLENITKMEVALGQDIILTDEQARERYGKVDKESYRPFQTIHCAGKADQSDLTGEVVKEGNVKGRSILLKSTDQEEKGISELAY